MPELPEVEVTRRSIAEPLAQSRVLAVRMGKPLRWPLGCEAQALAGRMLGTVTRRGKYLWLPLGPRPGHDPDDAGGLLLHLGMSGSLAFRPEPADGDATAPPPLGPHDHFELLTQGPSGLGRLCLHDPRRFGAVVFAPGIDQPPAATLLARLGSEPFDPALTPQAFHESLRRRHAPVKNVLLSGKPVVGAGNIYACEALFQAGIDPRTRADKLSRPRAERLLQAVRDTLARALELGGSTLRDFSDAHGMDGAFQHHAAVYGREGQACPRCALAVRRIVQGQRATYFCPQCQRR
jgi:formamidopyrimidine-DNA glycosylase